MGLLQLSLQVGKSYNNDRVLFISSYSYAWDTVQCQIEGIKKGIAPGVTVDYEFMDTKRFSSNSDIEEFYKGFKYRMSRLEPSCHLHLLS